MLKNTLSHKSRIKKKYLVISKKKFKEVIPENQGKEY